MTGAKTPTEKEKKDQTEKQCKDYLTSYKLSGYHADTPITIKAEAIHEADSHIH